MATIKLEIVTAERMVYEDDVTVVVAPGVEGQLGILPHHAPLMSMLQQGELFIRRGEEEIYLALTGGFLEVRPDKVIVLADACERVEEIDIARAEAAKARAEDRLREGSIDMDIARTEAALRRSLIRLKIAERRRTKRERGV